MSDHDERPVTVHSGDLALALRVIDDAVGDLSDDEWDAIGRLRMAVLP